MAFKTRRAIVLSAAAVAALAGCGGGGGSDSPTGTGGTPSPPNPVASLKSGTSLLIAFPGDTRQLTLTATDAAGAIVANPTVTWTSSNTAVATVDSTGKITIPASAAPGAANIVATSGDVKETVPLTVKATPTTLAELNAAFPFTASGSNPNGASWNSKSTISQAFSDLQQLRMSEVTAEQAKFFPKAADPMDYYFTNDNDMLTRHVARLLNLSPEATASITNLLQFTDDDGRVQTYFYIGPTDSPLNAMLHDFGETSLDASVRNVVLTIPDAARFGWLQEGMGLYWESGSFDASDKYVWSKLRSDIVVSYKANFAADPSTADVSVLEPKAYSEISGTPSFASSAVLVTFLMTEHLIAIKQLVAEMAAGGIYETGTFPMTGAGIMDRLLVLLTPAGISTRAQLTNAYSLFGLGLL
jgi:hypothetical protein